MLTLTFSFDGGRYHGTPWGRHVNEADVAWPPDLWRLSRALIATWHRKLDHATFSRAGLVDLLAALASEPPRYRLPDAVHFHTRHYMPVRDKSTLIFDAFAQVGRDAQLLMHWPNLALTGEQTALLDALLAVLGYLGRAESWVTASRASDWSGTCDCYPAEVAVDPDTGEIVGDLVGLWLPQSPDTYAAIREAQLDAALAQARAEALAKRAAALASGKKGPDPDKAKIPAEVIATLPEDWLDALSLDTGELQSAGWSDPPAARRIYYVRRKDALRYIAARSHVRRTAPRARRPINTARFAVYGRPLPRVTDAVRVGELLRIALMGRARQRFGESIPTCLSGHDLPAGNRHGHAFFLPEADSSGRIDHLIVHAPSGLDPETLAAINDLAVIYSREGAEWRVLLEGAGVPADFAMHSLLLRESHVWESVTPYLHPWHRKRGFEVPAQIARECELRGLPAPVSVQPLPDRRPRALEFHRFRSKRGLDQPDRTGCLIELMFPEPIKGPLALGFACHFGLGLFRAVSRAHAPAT